MGKGHTAEVCEKFHQQVLLFQGKASRFIPETTVTVDQRSKKICPACEKEFSEGHECILRNDFCILCGNACIQGGNLLGQGCLYKDEGCNCGGKGHTSNICESFHNRKLGRMEPGYIPGGSVSNVSMVPAPQGSSSVRSFADGLTSNAPGAVEEGSLANTEARAELQKDPFRNFKDCRFCREAGVPRQKHKLEDCPNKPEACKECGRIPILGHLGTCSLRPCWSCRDTGMPNPDHTVANCPNPGVSGKKKRKLAQQMVTQGISSGPNAAPVVPANALDSRRPGPNDSAVRRQSWANALGQHLHKKFLNQGQPIPDDYWYIFLELEEKRVNW